MFRFTLRAFAAVCVTAVVASFSAATAQEAAAPEAAEPAQAAPPSNRPYFREDVGDWRIRCVSSPVEGQEDACQLYQLLTDQAGNPVAEFTLLPAKEGQEGPQGGALATVVTPLETLLPPGIRLSVDDSPEQVIPFTWCSTVGCYARFALGEPDIGALKAGGEATISITPLTAPDRQVVLTSSLSGFTRAFTLLSEE